MAKIQPPYKNETNQRYSKQLFHEMWVNLPIEKRTVEPAFTLYQKKDGLICLREEYVKDEDPTGYTTAMRIFGEYAYWTYLMGVAWFREAKKTWDLELDAKLESKGLTKIIAIANSDDKGALQAARYLANLEYHKTGAKRGRPTNDEVEGRLKAAAEELSQSDEDARRIGLVARN